MAYPTVTLSAVNQIFAVLKIEVRKHDLGYYEATGMVDEHGEPFQEIRLLDLTHVILKHLVKQEKISD